MARRIKGLNAHIDVECAECRATIRRRPFRPYDGAEIKRFFCNRSCKGSWQRAQKPWGESWLREKYLVEGFSANEIALIVGRDPKRVWEWLRDYGIETRERGHVEQLRFKPGQKSWWKGRSHSEDSRRKISIANTGKPKHPKGEKHHWAGKMGPAHPTWNGGGTPDRQAFYGSKEWKAACVAIWHRADARCERCGKDSRLTDRSVEKFHIHHIVSFAIKAMRAVPSNLVLLCEPCHRFVHSRKNTTRELLEAKCKSAA